MLTVALPLTALYLVAPATLLHEAFTDVQLGAVTVTLEGAGASPGGSGGSIGSIGTQSGVVTVSLADEPHEVESVTPSPLALTVAV